MLQTPLCSGQSADFTPRKLYSTRDASWRVKLALHHWLKISSGISSLLFIHVFSFLFFSFSIFIFCLSWFIKGNSNASHFLVALTAQSSFSLKLDYLILVDRREQEGGLETRSCTFFMHQLNSQTDSTFVVVFSKERTLEKRWENLFRKKKTC